jgi:hypothetical protein
MTNENRIAHRAQAAMGSLKKLFVRKPAKPAENHQSWAMSSTPKATEPVGKDVTDAVDR